MASQPPPVILRFDLDDKGGVKIERVNAGLDKMDKQSARTSKAVKQFDGTLMKLRGTIAGLAAGLSLGAVVAVVRSTARELDEVAKRAYGLGMTTEALSELSYAANLSGVSAEKLGVSLRALTRFSGMVANGNKEAAASLATLGIEAGAFLRATPDRRLALLADGFARIDSGAQRGAIAMRVFGDEGLGMLNMLDGGSEGLARMRDEAVRLGVSIDSELAAKAEAFNDALTRLGAGAKTTRNLLVENLLLPAAIEANTLANQWAQLNARMGQTNSTIIPNMVDAFAGIPDEINLMLLDVQRGWIGLRDLTDEVISGSAIDVRRMVGGFTVGILEIVDAAKRAIREVEQLANSSPGTIAPRIQRMAEWVQDTYLPDVQFPGTRSPAERAAAGVIATPQRKTALQEEIDAIKATMTESQNAASALFRQRQADRAAEIAAIDYQIQVYREMLAANMELRAEQRAALEAELLGNVEIRRQKLEALAAAEAIAEKSRETAQAQQANSAALSQAAASQRSIAHDSSVQLSNMQGISDILGAWIGKKWGPDIARFFGIRPQREAAVFHDGGVVTSSAPMRPVGALRADEVPAILQTGEVVLSRADVAAISRAASSGQSGGDPQPVMVAILPEKEFNNYMAGPRGIRAMRPIVRRLMAEVR